MGGTRCLEHTCASQACRAQAIGLSSAILDRVRRRTRLPPRSGIVLLGLLLLAGCTTTGSGGPAGSAEALPTGLVGPVAPTVGPDALRYVALGDSYTIGTSVLPAERWPDPLVATLGGDAGPLELVANLGVNGYTSADLIREELPALDRLRPELVSVLIGVNDVVGGVPPATYEANLQRILRALLGRLAPGRVFTVTIPDYTVTPAGADYGDPRRQHDAIVAANAAMARSSEAAGIACIDIVDLSLRAARDRALVARDGLHPSAAQYAVWVERIVPVVRRLIAG